MGDDMRLRGFALKTQQAYRGAVVRLATHFTRSPDTLDALTEGELRAFFLDLAGEAARLARRAVDRRGPDAAGVRAGSARTHGPHRDLLVRAPTV